MSAGGYESPHVPSSYSSYGSRRASGLASGIFDRAPNGTTRRASPSPGASRRLSFDRSQRGAPPYQSEYQNSYRPNGANSYRPEYGNSSYYSRSPSPDRHVLPRSADSDSWDRHGQWKSVAKSSNWSERKVVPPSPTASISHERSRSGDDIMATRMFEPSDAWKQTHVNRPLRGDSYRPDHRYDYRSRKDESPERSRSDNGSFYVLGGDRYRPTPPKWDSQRSEYHSSRPQYEGVSSWNQSSREPLSPSGSYRRDSLSAPHSRLSDHYEPSYNDRRVSSRSATGSVSPHPRTRSPPDGHDRLGRSSSRDRSYYSAYDSDSSNYRRYDMDDSGPRRRKHSRSTSRSSIASSVNTNPHLPTSRLEPVLPDPNTNRARGLSVHSVSSQSAVPKSDGTLNCPSTTDVVKPKNDALSGSSNFIGKPLKLNGPLLNEVALSAKPSLPFKPIIPEIQQAPSSQVNGKSDQNIPAHPIPIKNSNSIVTQQSRLSSVNAPTSTTSAFSPVAQVSPTPLVVSATSQPCRLSPNSGLRSPEKLVPNNKVDIPPSAPVEPMLVDDPPSNTPRVLSPSQPESNDSIVVGCNVSVDAIPTVDEDAPQTHEQSDTRFSPLPTELPQLSEAKSLKEALRAVVMTRLLCDRQPREERVEPILAANHAIATEPEVDIDSTPEQVIQEVHTGRRAEKRIRIFRDIKPAMLEHFRKRHSLISAKAEELKEEYISLQQLWNDHRAALNQQNKALAAEQEQIHHTGRTTRRTATLGDAVRSDLEMEQIIASLGYDEATDPSILCLRNVATIPDMISVTHGKIDYYFDDTNNRVDNPSEYYAPETGMHDWTEEEKEIFVSKFAAHPKQFGIIADFLPNKTPAQCVAFYYLHKHKHIDFRKVVSTLGPNKRRRRGGGKKKSNALLTDIAQHDEQVGRDGAASPAGGRPKRGRKPNPEKPTSTRKQTSAIPSGIDDTTTAASTPEPDTKPKRGRGRPPGSGKKAAAAVAAAVIVAASTTGTPITTNVALDTPAATPTPIAPTPSSSKNSPREEVDQEPDPDDRPTKRTKRVRKVKSAPIINDDEVGTSTTGSPAPSIAPTSGVEVSSPMDTTSNANLQTEQTRTTSTESTTSPSTQWSEEDKKLFVSLLEQHGADFRRIASSMPNQQTSTQISLYYKHNREKLSLEKIAARAPKRTKSPDPSLNNPMSASVMTASTATSIKSVGRIPKVRTNGTSATTEPKAKSNEDEAPPMGSLTPPPPVTAPTSSQEPKMPEILKGWGSIMSRERPPPPPPRHAPKPKHTSRRPQSMSEVHSPSSSPPQSNASLPSTPVTSSFIPAAILPALPASLPPRPIAGLPAKPAPATTGLSRHYPTANYASTTNAASSSSASNNSKPTTSAIPMAATGITTGVNLPMIPLNRAPRTPSGYSTTGSGTTSYQASASSAYPSRPSPYAVYPYGGEQRYPPVYGPPPPPRPPFTATSSGSSTGTTGQKDGHSHYSVYPHGGSYYYSSSS